MNDKRINCAYLYADGHGIEVWEKFDINAGRVQWVEVYEQYVPQVSLAKGRIVLHGDALPALVKKMHRVEAKVADIKNGTEHTKKLNLPVEVLTLVPLASRPLSSISFHNIIGMLQGEFAVQHDICQRLDEVEDLYSWSTYRIAKVHKVKKEKVS